MLFNKKNKTQPAQPLDYGQKFFKIAAFIFLIFVLYETYSNDIKGRIAKNDNTSEANEEDLSKAKINQKVQEAFDKMYENPEYKKIQDFVNYIEKNVDKKNGTALKTPEGYLLFIPFETVFKDNSVPDSKIVIKSEETEFYIDYKITQKVLETPPANKKTPTTDKEIEALKSNIENAEKDILMEEIAKKNGKPYIKITPPAKEVSISPSKINQPTTNNHPKKPTLITDEKKNIKVDATKQQAAPLP